LVTVYHLELLLESSTENMRRWTTADKKCCRWQKVFMFVHETWQHCNWHTMLNWIF